MTTQVLPDRTPALFRFLDSFLQENNIKWVLAVGTLILLGSSCMLVAAHWNDYTPTWKYLIMLAYTGLIHMAGQWSFHSLGLRKTGTVLMALTVLLLPALFFALHWVQASPAATAVGLNLLNLGLLGGTAAFSALAARRIFKHFLHGSQPTFLASYLILSVAAALAPALPSGAAWWASLLLWAVFVAGTVKVNRHVFWLTEQHQAPRIFGFFPIALLGTLFLTVFALNFASQIAIEWLGLGCLLVAVPVLLTADTVAGVFQQRSGGLTQRQPAVIVLPLLVGMILCAAGVAMTGSGLMPGHSPLAITPTAALAAVMMALVAQRVQKSAFVWAMLVVVTVAYNFSPFFFQELARSVLDASASAVQEKKLPYAFYGLTYLPLIAALTAASVIARRADTLLFSRPLQNFNIALSCLLLLPSLGHVKAMLPVGVAMTLVFAIQTVLYQQRVLAALAIGSWLAATFGLAPFCISVLGLELWPGATAHFMAVAAILLLAPGYWIDGRLERLPEIRFWTRPLCQSLSLLLSLGLAVQWLHNLDTYPSMDLANIVLAISIAGLLGMHALRWLQPWVGGIAIGFAYLSGIGTALALGVAIDEIFYLVTLTLLGQWGLRYGFARSPEARLTRAFGKANSMLAGIGLGLLFTLIYLPWSILGNIFYDIRLDSLWPLEICRILMVVWMFDAARCSRRSLLTLVGSVSVLALAGALLMSVMGREGWTWLPTLWVAIAWLALSLNEWLRRRLHKLDKASTDQDGLYRAIVRPIDALILAVFGFAVGASLLVYTLPLWIAGALASAGLMTIAVLRREPASRLRCLALINWQLIALTVITFAPQWLDSALKLGFIDASAVCLPVALVATISVMFWRRYPGPAALAKVQLLLLRAVSGMALVGSLALVQLTLVDIAIASLTFGLLVASELWTACRQQQEIRVWTAEAVIAAGVAYFALQDAISFGHGFSMFIVLGVGIGAWIVGRLATSRPTIAVLVRPLQITGLTLPMIAVAIGLFRHFANPEAGWLGQDSLALLLAAGFYFWYGLEYWQRSSLVVSAAILNLAMILLWRELSWSDPQFYMVPIGVTLLALARLLRDEIPEKFHDPLNYLGALLILVSPTFHIATGSWLHLFTLMLASVAVVLVAIGLRIRALIYTGAAFLAADLVAMIVRGSIDNPSLLWLAGLLLGAAVVVLGAVAERNRERLLQRLRAVSATLESWN